MSFSVNRPTSVLERGRALEQRVRKKRGRESRIRMRLESWRNDGARDRGGRMLDPGTDNPFATEPGDGDFQAGRIDGANRRHWTGGSKCRKEQREAQAPVHVRKYDIARVI